HLTYDPVRGLSPVSLVALYPLILVVPNVMPVRTVAEFIEYAKAHPDLPCGTSGAGSPQHLCGTVFGTRTGASFNYVHYRGGAPAVSDMLSGQLQVLFAPLPEALTHVQGGSFRALAVTGTTRSALLPDVPTVAETLPGYDMPMWNAMFVPAGTPQPIIDRLSREVASVLQMPDVRQKFIEGAFEPVGNTPAELDQFRTAELPRWAEIVRDSGATLD
ncbi:MAG: hypothetical protein JWR10_339, partial [Rubritepida sp.]|nr:hypothetical protein [Rubritepida sp.]